VAQFSVSLASEDATAGFLLNGMQFDLTATATNNQILFFKWTTTEAEFNWRNLVLSVADDVFQTVAQTVADKVAAHVAAFVKAIPDL